MKTFLTFISCALSLFIAQGTLSAEQLIKETPSQLEQPGESEASWAIFTIYGPTLIEVNTVNVYGFNQFSSNHGPGYTYEWTLLCADDPSISPFYMGYNTGSTCSFICYEPVNLFLWLDVKYNGEVVGHAETMVTVLPTGSL